MYLTWGRGARCSRRVITARACARGPLCSGELGGAVAGRAVYLSRAAAGLPGCRAGRLPPGACRKVPGDFFESL